jgi:hypothetical protein
MPTGSANAEAVDKCRKGGKRMQTIEKVLSARNLTEACSEVVKNKGAGGIDGMNVGQLKSYLDLNREELCETIREGKYIPQPIRGKEIPKRNGKVRLLGIPTVVDRMLQQAVLRVIMPQFEYMFSDYSYGFRPQRNTQQAVLKSLEYINSGYQHIVDIDLKGFFDEVDHCLLLDLLYRKVKCPDTMQLIRRWLKAPIWVNGKLLKRRKGVPQEGGALRKCPVDIFSERASQREGSARYCPTSCYMSWTKKWKDKDSALCATLMTLVFTAKLKAKQGRKATRFTSF